MPMHLLRTIVLLLMVSIGQCKHPTTTKTEMQPNKISTFIKNGIEVACSGDPYCEAQPFIECCPEGPDAALLRSNNK
jgi:hypothetical protein